MIEESNFSVLMSIYNGEDVKNFSESLTSVSCESSLKPNEIILVIDGYIRKELQLCIEDWQKKIPYLFTIPLEKNVGLGEALRIGLLACKCPVVARMDTDDIADQQRFEKQIQFLETNPQVDIVGSWIAEFETNPRQITGLRKLPEQHKDLLKFAQWRDPVNHMTVMFRKDAVINAGNYESHLWFEDTWLWARMLKRGAIFHNLQEPLVLARAGTSMLNRRRGLKYLKSELALFNKLHEMKFISSTAFIINIVIRVPLRLLPKSVISFIFRTLLRSKA